MILLFQMCICFGQDLGAQKRIVIDAGHGGIDSGALARNGAQEKDIVLNVAQEVLRLNSSLKEPHLIFLTRSTDTLISLGDRTRLAMALDADLFLSLHCNHAKNVNARGVEVYAYTHSSKYSNTAVWIAYLLQNQFKKQLGFESRGVKFSNFQVLRDTAKQCPALLLELGFLSNADENSFLTSEENATRMALIILNILETN